MTRLYEFLINSKSTGIIKNINDDFVDLGLSVLWASCNIGAKEETDYGHYYQWGGLKPMDNKQCDWINCPFNNGENCFNKKYFESIKDKVCPNNILSKEYDIAYQTYGGNVHMPTSEECDDLIYETKNEWIDNYNESKINGMLFTAKNGKSIFIPAGGVLGFSKDNYKLTKEVNISSSSLKIHDNSLHFSLYSVNYGNNDERININTLYRSVATNIRAVKDK